MTSRLTTSALAAVLVLAACSSSSDSDVTARASAVLRNAEGTQVGTASLVENDNGAVTVTVNVQGMTEGNHGMHIHGTGSCVAEGGFSSAGPHYNPFTKLHGLDNPDGAHAGDMPNIPVAANGTGTRTYQNPRVRLTPGTNNLLDADGSAIVVHAGTDDQITDPQGNSGARFACGVIVAD